MNWLFLIFSWLIWQAEEPLILPVGQVHIEHTTTIFEYPNQRTQSISRAREGDVRLIYEILGNWGRTENGWLSLEGLSLETAVVHYSLDVSQSISLDAGEILPGEIAGVVGIFEDQALVYSKKVVGWVQLADLTLLPPTPDLLNFVEQTAYIKVDGANFYLLPDIASESISIQPLGEKVSILHTIGDWVLVLAGQNYGWSEAANFDILPRGIVSGQMNAGPVNLRLIPVEGRVIAVLSYLEEVLVIGRNTAGNWLYLEARDLRGWVSAQYVNFEGEIMNLPEIQN